MNPGSITIEGFAKALLSLPHLERLGRAQSLFAIIREVHRIDPKKILKLKYFENSYDEVIGSNNGDKLGLNIVAKVCPDLAKITIHVDRPDLSAFETLRRLHTLQLKGVIRGPHHKRLGDLLGRTGHNLKILEIRNGSEMTLNDIQKISFFCPNLQSLVLHQCTFEEDEFLQYPIKNENKFSNLKVFYFSPYFSPNPSPINPIIFVLTNAINLQQVFIERCSQISDKHLKNVLEIGGFKHLRNFQLASDVSHNLPYYNDMTVESVHNLTEFCPALEDLGDLSKWNVKVNVIEDLEGFVRENNLNLQLSSNSMRSYRDKTFFCA